MAIRVEVPVGQRLGPEAVARREATKTLGSSAVVRGVKIISTGQEGFLGIGREPAKYEADVFVPAQSPSHLQAEGKDLFLVWSISAGKAKISVR